MTLSVRMTRLAKFWPEPRGIHFGGIVGLIEEVLLEERSNFVPPHVQQRARRHDGRHEKRVANGVMAIQGERQFAVTKAGTTPGPGLNWIAPRSSTGRRPSIKTSYE